MLLNQAYLDKVIKNALEEDLSKEGDITSRALLSKGQRGRAVIIPSETGILAGIEVAKRVFELLDKGIKFSPFLKDGEVMRKGQMIASLEGLASAILAGERTALNFLQHLSGIATLTAKFVEKVEPYGVTILDTRKTLPGLRKLEKYAVKIGGGKNHRFGLFDGILIKDNHIKLAGGICEAVSRVKKRYSRRKIEVEAEDLKEVKEALESGADVIMLDNMDIKTMRRAVKLISKKALVEASGGISFENVEEVAKIGVDSISLGAITLKAHPIDISLEIIT